MCLFRRATWEKVHNGIYGEDPTAFSRGQWKAVNQHIGNYLQTEWEEGVFKKGVPGLETKT